MVNRLSARRAGAIALAAGLAWAGLSSPASAAPAPDPLPLGNADLQAAGMQPGGEVPTGSARPMRASGKQAYLLKLNVRPTAKVWAAGGKDAEAGRAARNQLSTIKAAQRAVIADLPTHTSVLYRTHAAISGVAVRTDAKNVQALSDIRGVSAVYPIAPKTQNLTSSIPLQGGPSAWKSVGSGSGMSIAIIDSGIDYTHADFGGPGTTQAFDDAQAIVDDSWIGISPQVVGGYDFAGDAYDGDNIPQPDGNPVDCVQNGHGTHVAGIAAGQGVTKANATYPGPYDDNIDYDKLAIGPGMAPQAELYAYRVFGCEGSTWLVTEAIDAAVDPDGDGNPSDHVDVINMSLGSDFGSALEADAIVSNAAVDAGVVVVASAGNGGDITDIAGSPANATKAISVANSVDALSILDGASLTIDGSPATYEVTRSIRYDWDADPDLTGNVVLAPDTNPTACAPFDPTEAAALAGNVVLVKWTQEALECGSITRGANLYAAGATGFIFANSAETFDGGINGDKDIPGVLMVKSGGDAIRNALLDNKTVTVNGTSVNSMEQDIPADIDKVAGSSSRGIRSAGNLKPDITAVGTTVFSAAVGTGTQGISETGTSMSGPTVAGLAALVAGANPTWTPHQVKAAIMNTASDLSTDGNGMGLLFAPVRVGAGRIQADQAVDSLVTASVKGDPGAVSVSFGPVEVGGPMTLTKTIEVRNDSAAPMTYDVDYEGLTFVDGVDFTVSPQTVNVPAGSSRDVTVTFEAQSRAALDNSVDPTIGRWTFDGLPRSTVAEASGRVLLTPDAGTQLRVPVYAAPRPVSSLTAGSQVALDPSTQKATVTMSGDGLGFGVNGTADSDPSNGIYSIGAAFELAATSPAAPECTLPGQSECVTIAPDRMADVRRVGVTTADGMAYFAITSDKPWNTPASVAEFDVYIDADNDGKEEFVVFNTRYGDTDVMVSALFDVVADEVIDIEYLNALSGTVDTAQYDSDTMVLPVWLDALTSAGIDVNSPRVHYGVAGWSPYSADPIDLVGINPNTGAYELTADLFTPGLKVHDVNGQPIYWETGGTSVQATRNQAVYSANGSQGLMLVHFHNAVGAKSEVLGVTDAPGATTTTLQPSATSVEVNKPVSLAVAVTGTTGTPTGPVTVVAAETGATLASGTLDATGKATLNFTPSSTGTVRMLAKYAGDASHSASSSAESALTVTATPVGPTPKKQQRFAASLPRRIKLQGLTLITPANARTNADQPVKTRVSGRPTAAGQTRLFTVVRGKNGKVSVRTYGHRGLRLEIVQKAPATDAYTKFKRQAVYVNGQRRR